MSSPSEDEPEIFSLVYWDLRRLAQRLMTAEAKQHTLQPTALVHEAFLRLADNGDARCWRDRGRFVALASHVMQHILVDHARRNQAQKRGGGWERSAFEDCDNGTADEEPIQALREAIDKLEALDPRKAQLVKLRYFDGMTIAEAAARLGVSAATAAKDWTFARSWLKVELGETV